MDFDIVNPWIELGLKGLVTLSGVVVLVWIGRAWLETQLLGVGGFILAFIGLAAALGGIGGLALLGPRDASGPRVEALEREVEKATAMHKSLAAKIETQTQQLLALEKDLTEQGGPGGPLAAASRLVITGADPKTYKSGWILTYLNDDGTAQSDTFEFVRTRRPGDPLKAIRRLVDKDMWQRIQDGKVKAERGVIVEAATPTQ